MDDKEKVTWYEKRYGPVIERRGLHNWKNLFRKPNIYEWTILFMIILTILSGFLYMEDTKTCRETLKNIDNICIQYCTDISVAKSSQNTEKSSTNYSEIFKDLIINEEIGENK
jgi:hypothetical protein